MFRSWRHIGFEVAARVAPCNIEDTIVVSGSPRSGTTWVLELFRLLPGYKAMNEPLMYEEARRDHGFSWRTHLAPEAAGAQQYEHLNDLLRGKAGTPAWHHASSSYVEQLWELATRRKLVVKFCRLNRMMHWFAGQFEVRGIIFVVRHPCAVVSSMRRHGGWDEENVEAEQVRDYAEPDDGLPPSLERPFVPILDRIESRIEALATLWCLDHYVPLVEQAEGVFPWTLVPYERLVTAGRNELRRITDALGVEVTPQMKDKLRAPSSSVKGELHRDAERQLSKWKRHLSSAEADAILRIVEEVGLSRFYTEELEPNYEALNRRQDPETPWTPKIERDP